jgi:hypothetical protein
MSLRLLRLILACALALTVPIQGFAAASAGLCMALGHHDDGGHSHGDDPAGAANCAPCVACCASAAISGSGGIALPEEGAVAVMVADTPSLAGIQPDALERPPLAP